MLCAALSYYFLPNVEQKFKYITPGSVLGTLAGWALPTGFSIYVGHFGRYNVTYGSIGGVIILMTWFFISGFIFLMGGEINAILEHASDERQGARARAPRAKRRRRPRSARARCRSAPPTAPPPAERAATGTSVDDRRAAERVESRSPSRHARVS